MLGFVFYVFRDLHDLPLAIVLLIAFSTLYTLVRIYFAHKDWRLLAAALLVVVAALGYFFLRPQGIILSVNDQEVTTSSVILTEGSVFVNPAPSSDGKYSKGTVVSLTASPNSGYDLKSWTGTSNDISNPTTVTMSSRKQVSVTFEPRSLLIINNQVVSDSVMNFSEGSVSLDPSPGDDDKYAKGTVVTLTANPDPAYGLKNWSGTATDMSNPTKVTINSDKHVTVTFELRFPLIVNSQQVSSPTANFTDGLVSINPLPKDDGRYSRDTTVTLTAIPETGYRFDKWSGDASGNTATVTISMNSAKNITAVFKKVYNLSTSVNATGSGSVSPASGSYDTGSTVTLTASPAAGYRFDRWDGDVSANTTTITINITMNADKNITAVFKKVYALTTSVNPSGSGSVSPASGSYDDGVSLILTAQAATGYRFDHWEGGASGNVTATVNMTASKNVIAFFNKITP